jgi:hypothetical protein
MMYMYTREHMCLVHDWGTMSATNSESGGKDCPRNVRDAVIVCMDLLSRTSTPSGTSLHTLSTYILIKKMSTKLQHMFLTCTPVRFSEGRSGADLQKLVGVSDGGPKIVTFDELMRQGKLMSSVKLVHYVCKSLLCVCVCVCMYVCARTHTYAHAHMLRTCIHMALLVQKPPYLVMARGTNAYTPAQVCQSGIRMHTHTHSHFVHKTNA